MSDKTDMVISAAFPPAASLSGPMLAVKKEVLSSYSPKYTDRSMQEIFSEEAFH